jgi:diguanylate cyclase
MSYRILAIEDEFPVLDTITDILTFAGYLVDSASNGEEGLQMAFDDPPDLILCDIVMPGLDGYQLLQQIKMNPLTRSTRFIFITARSDAEDIKKGMRQGADDYITKPFSTGRLLEKVAAQFKKQNTFYSRESYQIQSSGEFHELAGLGNATLLNRHLKEFERDRSKKTAVLIVHIDRINEYKSLLENNEKKLLKKKVIERIRNNLTNAQKLYFFSLGKYAVLIESPDDKSPAVLADKILRSVMKPIHLQYHTLHLTANAGIAAASEIDDSVNLIKQAEISLEYAMDSDHQAYVIYQAKYKKPYHDIRRMDLELHNALKKEELTLVYQPKFNLTTSRVSGYEALLRWNHPIYGSIPPSRFIPLAESSNFIGEIGNWVINKIFEQLKAWEFSGIKLRPLAINVSAGQINDEQYLQHIERLLNHSDIDIRYIEFDLTESIFIQNPTDIKAVLEVLTSTGISLALDDFGMGCSSLSYLNNFPFSKIKIDKSYIHAMSSETSARILVAEIISMARKIGFKVIAEGVEKEEQVEFLRQNNCDEIQGFYYGKPVPVDQLKQIM